MEDYKKFQKRTLKGLKAWSIAGRILPLTALSGIFYIWIFGDDTLFDIVLTVGSTIMFGTAVYYWWWALRVIRRLLIQLDHIKNHYTDGLEESIKQTKEVVRQITNHHEDR